MTIDIEAIAVVPVSTVAPVKVPVKLAEAVPTAAAPGSREKLQAVIERVKAGQAAWSPGDAAA
ncbi:hypothetical protein BH11PLA2_BH11PLA2_29200 [soil metagenome]